MASMQMLTDLNLVLIGNNGNGKSATGNSILKKNAFESRAETTAVTQKVVVSESKFENGQYIRVVDTPGVCDPDKDDSISTQIRSAMDNAMTHCKNGYHAVLLVFRFGVMSRENKEIINNLQEIFGESFMKDYCIIIVTHGDNFEIEMKETGETFKDWCRKQGTFFQNLLERCENRILLFDNKTTDETKRDDQRQKLIDMVINFQLSTGTRLTKQRYDLALPPPPAPLPPRRGCFIL